MAEQKRQGPPPGMGRRHGPGGPMVIEKPKNMWGTLKRLFKYIGYQRYILFGLLGVMLEVMADSACLTHSTR